MPGPLILQQPFTSQPQFAPAIATSNPLAAGLVDAILPVGGRVISVGPNLKYDNFTDVSGPTYNTGVGGTSRRYSFASAQYSNRPSVPLSQVKECTFLVYWSPGTSASNAGAVFAYGSSTTNNPFVVVGWATGNQPYFRVQDTAATNQTVTGTGAKLTTQSATQLPHVQVCTRSQSLNFVRTYVDGIIDTNTTATTMGAWAADRTAVGVLLRAAVATQQDVFNFHVALVWNRALSPAEVASISANPWQVFEAPPKRLWSNAPSGGSTISGDGASAGTSTVTGVSAATAAEVGSSSGTSTVSGVGASTNAQVGNSTGTSTVSGTSAATAASVGNSDGTSTATAASAVTLSGVGNATGTSTAAAISQSAAHTVGGYPGGYHAFADKRRKQQKQQSDDLAQLLKRLMGLLPKEPNEEIIEAKVEAAKAVAKVEEDTSEQDALAMQRATLLVAKLEALLRAYESRVDEEDEDLLLLS